MLERNTAKTKAKATKPVAGTRERILRAAVNEFAAKGFSGGRIDTICGAGRVNIRMIYHHFGDKEGLYIAALEETLSGLRSEELKQDLIILGFDKNTLAYYDDILGEIVTILLEPFYCAEPYDFADWRLHYKINTLLASRGWDEPFEIPARLSGVIRMFHGLYYYARKYRICFNWHDSLRSVLSQSGKERKR